MAKRSPPAASAPGFDDAAAHMADGMARICRLYGVSPLAGRLHTALLLSPEPVSLEALCAAVGAAKSSVSVTLRKLESARVVRRLPPRRDRRDHYEAVGDPWAVLAEWSRFYFTPELEMFRETTAGVLASLDAGGPGAPAGGDREALRARLDAWRAFAETIADLLAGARAERGGPAPARRIAVTVDEGES